LNTIIEKLKDWYSQLYWWIVGYVEITVKWPEHKMIIGKHGDPGWYDVGATYVEFETSDPNDHYRPFLEEWIGRQGRDWDWYLRWHGRNIETQESNGYLTIRMRKKHAIYASHIALMWN
jgi:hypothetical protein